jgi:hypothetical protein
VTLPSPTTWQEAASCARGCLDSAREELPEAAWPAFINYLAVLVSREQAGILLRELRSAENS